MPVSPIVAQPRPQTLHSPGAPPITSTDIKLQSSWEIREVQVTQSRPCPRPERLLLGTLGDSGFRVVKPITVEVEFREGGVITSWQDIDEFGTGPAVYSSVEDLGRTVAELYRSLHADEDNLGPEMQRIWAILQEHIVPRR